jgi:hypothetical protein
VLHLLGGPVSTVECGTRTIVEAFEHCATFYKRRGDRNSRWLRLGANSYSGCQMCGFPRRSAPRTTLGHRERVEPPPTRTPAPVHEPGGRRCRRRRGPEEDLLGGRSTCRLPADCQVPPYWPIRLVLRSGPRQRPPGFFLSKP